MSIKSKHAELVLALALMLLGIVRPAAGDEPPQFNRDIRPILSDKCFACHGPGGTKAETDLRLDLRPAAVKAKAITPGKPEASELLARVASSDADLRMPPPESKLEPLTKQEIELLRRWIEAGAEYQDHWAFIPLQPITPPQAGLHPIDAFVQAGLAKRGLKPQPRAEKTTLLRRVTFDLTGLPPTPAEIEAFLADDSPQAFEKVVDRLLNSEAYGERMAVDWLDIARYADSYGFQVDREREMWPWRDWVIRSFNRNQPFDQFLTEQLAGDLLPNPTDDQILATAFNRLHQQESEGGSVEEEYRVEYVCDRVQTFATAFLGLTFECARCHDHKYDPIKQSEYYGLFAMFQNIDEAGLYSFFTPSPPTPTLLLTTPDAKTRLVELRKLVSEQETAGAKLAESRNEAFAAWLGEKRPAFAIPGEKARYPFDELKQGKLANAIEGGQPAALKGENKLAPGKIGQAVEFSGDDAVDLPLGNFHRYEPFSISLWLKTPDHKDRAVVLHRSRAWTDAASRGYELLIVDGKLQWSLIHFWPGNAISITTEAPLPLREWVQVVLSSDGSSTAAGLKIFVNGRPAVTKGVKDNLSKEITGGGGDNIALGERFRDRGFRGGLIDELRIFGRELSALEALACFDSAAAEKVWNQPAELLAPAERELLKEYYLKNSDPAWKAHQEALLAARRNESNHIEGVREIMVMRELPQPKKAYVLFRGEYNQRREEAPPTTPAALSPFPHDAPKNRLGLARWLTDRRHPLTARVTVNRFWQAIFGRGLVRTAEDFGSQGSRPLYPELLDWLALRFIDSGWDVKALHKTIVLSETYRQRSVGDAKLMADDPENELLARGPRFRLSAEMIRDNALAAAGLLVQRVGGPPVNPYEMSESFKPAGVSGGDGAYRRSLYTNWRRTGPPPALLAFDAPRRAVCIAKRERTDSPLQALILLNGVQYVEAARMLGQRVHQESAGDLARMIDLAALRCLSRKADAREKEILTQLYREQLAHFTQHAENAEKLLKIGAAKRDPKISAPEAAAATILAQALLAHDECVVKR